MQKLINTILSQYECDEEHITKLKEILEDELVERFDCCKTCLKSLGDLDCEYCRDNLFYCERCEKYKYCNDEKCHQGGKCAGGCYVQLCGEHFLDGGKCSNCNKKMCEKCCRKEYRCTGCKKITCGQCMKDCGKHCLHEDVETKCDECNEKISCRICVKRCSKCKSVFCDNYRCKNYKRSNEKCMECGEKMCKQCFESVDKPMLCSDECKKSLMKKLDFSFSSDF